MLSEFFQFSLICPGYILDSVSKVKVSQLPSSDSTSPADTAHLQLSLQYFRLLLLTRKLQPAQFISHYKSRPADLDIPRKQFSAQWRHSGPGCTTGSAPPSSSGHHSAPHNSPLLLGTGAGNPSHCHCFFCRWSPWPP